ncbi:MAG TPA: tetratricopeptide repeat protein, partial [Kofleriaceae bacterium]
MAKMNLGAIQERARAGDVRAQAELGYRFATGKGVRRDYRKAAYWDRLAADRGEPSAQYNLAQSHFSGRGVEKDVARALHLFGSVWANLRADDHLRAGAAVNLGWSARNGGRANDRVTARTWYQRAGRLGDRSGFYNLGLLGVEQGPKEAARYFRLGAALGHHKSMYELARLYVNGEIGNADAHLTAELVRTAARTVPR